MHWLCAWAANGPSQAAQRVASLNGRVRSAGKIGYIFDFADKYYYKLIKSSVFLRCTKTSGSPSIYTHLVMLTCTVYCADNGSAPSAISIETEARSAATTALTPSLHVTNTNTPHSPHDKRGMLPTYYITTGAHAHNTNAYRCISTNLPTCLVCTLFQRFVCDITLFGRINSNQLQAQPGNVQSTNSDGRL